jgi:hypothetical protein
MIYVGKIGELVLPRTSCLDIAPKLNSRHTTHADITRVTVTRSIYCITVPLILDVLYWGFY